jgi:16S rRNA (cytosine967-C5)-methyltransferase
MPRSFKRETPSRNVALDVLKHVRTGRYAEDALSERLDANIRLKSEDRALATELVYGVLRWQRRLDSIISYCSDHPFDRIQPLQRDILRLAVYQMFLLERVPAHAAVDQAVNQTHNRLGKKPGAFVNAVLRRALREADHLDTLPGDDAAGLAMYYSHPEWLVERWIHDYGVEQTREILEFNNSRPEIVVRVNTLRCSADQLRSLFNDNVVQADISPGLSDALTILSSPGPVSEIPGFQEGYFLVQDAASQMIAPLLGTKPTETVLDACAAPGGKSSHMAALTHNKSRIIAVDSNAERLKEMQRNLDRLGSDSVEAVHGDSSDTLFLKELGSLDRALVDAPCTSLGVLRRNPEAKYRTDPKTLTSFHKYQVKLLQSVAEALKPGGTLLYSVCSVTQEETSDVIRAFLRSHTNFEVIPISPEEVAHKAFVDDAGFFRTYPPVLGFASDGFFAARLSKRTS